MKSIQYGTVTLTNLTTATATINAVDMANSVLIFTGMVSAVQTTGAVGAAKLIFTNSTTITADRTTSSANTHVMAFCVVEFAPGVVRVQRDTIALAAATSGTKTIASVNTSKTFLSWLGQTTTDVAFAGIAPCVSRIDLTNATTVTGTQAVALTTTIGFEAVEFL